MPYKDLRLLSNSILGDYASTTFEKKVLLVMYYSELLALNFKEIDVIFKTQGREKIFNILYLEGNFVEHIFTLFMNFNLDTIMPKIFHELMIIQELLQQRKLLKSCNTSKFVQ